MKSIIIPPGKQVYCLSDMHLGFPDAGSSRAREAVLIDWIKGVESNVSDLFLLGDVFDFWFEYKKVVPKGFIRILGALAELADRGVRLHLFVGNHDLWMKDYFVEEIGARIYYEPTEFEFQFSGKITRVCMGHGDGMGPGDYGYKVLKKVFVNPLAKFLFTWLHPDLGVALAHAWSGTRKSSTIKAGEVSFDPETDYILAAVRERFALDQRESRSIDAYIFGHRHHPIAFELGHGVYYYNLGDWFTPAYKNAYVLKIDEKSLDFRHFQSKS